MILDTCALLWLAVDQQMLSQSTLSLIEDTPEVSFSAITAFEIGQKYHKGSLALSLPPTEWLQRAIEKHNLSPINLSAEICIRATELPEIHKDPFDRLIIASALTLGRKVVTTDANFAKYGVEVIN